MELGSGLSADPNMPWLSISFKPQEEGEEQQTINCSEPRYSILNESQVRQLQEDDIARVSEVIAEPRASAIILLRGFNWNDTKLLEHWLEDQPRVRTNLGLFAPSPPSDHHPTITCGICFETSMAHNSASCGHSFCNLCWSKYIHKSITQDATGCLQLTCPSPLCPAAVGEDMVESLASSHSDKEKFSKFLLRSYLEDSYLRHRMKWCPGPDCNRAIHFNESSSPSTNHDVECRCSHSFCWNCDGEAHSPVACFTAADWLTRFIDESETAKWLAVHTKACPSCRRLIERSQGCDKMTCPPPCQHTFCWNCLEPLSRSSSHHKCYKKPLIAAEAEVGGATRESVKKYGHYYEQWVGCLKSRRKAIEDLRELKRDRLGRLGLNYDLKNDFRGLIVRAWDKMIRCQRVLQWSYAYGYYFQDGQVKKKQFLELLLGQAESVLERLQERAEKELEAFLPGEASAGDFKVYCTNLSHLAFVTAKYFENLVNALEYGLPDVA